ncbi:hypothetical protein Y032_0003g1648 [Ancylostoma ceylanicum]|uniref:Uncharacterized protein n=1 Tax=Ancylostoma ceylanicum TaxID=53326 RepID=A0A016VZ32_9BILA|nr:hypothetical protein Y032_0003g1648 [Ancylostoma ceylanicum]
MLKTQVETRLGRRTSGSFTKSKQKRKSDQPYYGKGCILFCHKRNHSSTQCRTVSNQSKRRKTLREQNSQSRPLLKVFLTKS